MRRYVLALDPGKMTGWASYDRETGEFLSGQTNFEETCRLLLHRVGGPSHDQLDLVCESFIITVQTAKNTQATWSLELIGVARMVSELYCQQPLTLQQPASAKRFSSDERLKKLGWYTPGKGHANDAARHLMLYMVARKWWPEEFGSVVHP